MSKVQLGLPLSVVSRLNDDEKNKLISQQCTLLQVEDFEVEALRKMCQDKGKISKGFGLVYRYAGLIDEVRDTMSEFIQILASHSTFSNKQTDSRFAVSGSFHNDLMLVILKLIYLLSNWRRMQWIPRPILFDADGVLISFSMFFEKSCKYFAHLLATSYNDQLSSTNPLDSMSCEFSSNLLILFQVTRTHLTEDIPQNDVGCIINWFQEIMEIEKLIEDKWQEVLSGTLVYPWLTVLCLPYPDLQQNPTLTKWFVRYFKKYMQISKNIENILGPILEHSLMSGSMEQLADSLFCFRDVDKFQPFFKRPHNRGIAYISVKNQMQLGSVCPMVFRSTWIAYILSGLNHIESSPTHSTPSHHSFSRNSYAHVSQPSAILSPDIPRVNPTNRDTHHPHLFHHIQDPVSHIVIPSTHFPSPGHTEAMSLPLIVTQPTFSETLVEYNSNDNVVAPTVSIEHPAILKDVQYIPVDISVASQQTLLQQLEKNQKSHIPQSLKVPTSSRSSDGDVTGTQIPNTVSSPGPNTQSTQQLFTLLSPNAYHLDSPVNPPGTEIKSNISSVPSTMNKKSLSPRKIEFSEEKGQGEISPIAVERVGSLSSLKSSPMTSSSPQEHQTQPESNRHIVGVEDSKNILNDKGKINVQESRPASSQSQSVNEIEQTEDIVSQKISPKSRRNLKNKKAMIIKRVISEDLGDDEDDEEVIYLVRYDPSRHVSPHHASSSANHANNNFIDEQEDAFAYRPRMSSDPSHSHSQHHPIYFAEHRRSNPTASSSSTASLNRSDSPYRNQQPPHSHHPHYYRHSNPTIAISSSSPSYVSPATSQRQNGNSWSAKQRLRGIDFSAQSLSSALRQIDEESRLMNNTGDNSLIELEGKEFTAVNGKILNMISSSSSMFTSEQRKAAKKIAVWYMLIAPRRKLLRRLLVRDMMLPIVHDIVEISLQEVTVRHQRRRKMLRQGAAVKIQRHFRKWRACVAQEEAQHEYEERREVAWDYLDIWCRATKNGIRLFRFFQRFVRKKVSDTSKATTSPTHATQEGKSSLTSAITTHSGSGSKSKKMRVSIMQNFVISPTTGERIAIADVIEMYINEFAFYQKFGTIRRNSAPPVPIIHRRISARTLTDIMYDPQGNSLHMRNYDSYALCIQLAYRTYRARLKVWKRKLERVCMQRIILFIIRCTARRRRQRAERRRIAATKISKWFLGMRARFKLYEEVRSGLLLKLAWMNYMHYKKLKSQLRRVDRPITILLHGLRNITKKTLVTDEIHIVVSVWWNPLLHIVGEADAEQMIQSKPPQFIYRSHTHRVTTEDDKPVTDLQQNRHTLGNMVQRANDLMNLMRPTHVVPRSSVGNDNGANAGSQPASSSSVSGNTNALPPTGQSNQSTGQSLPNRHRRSADIHHVDNTSPSTTTFARKSNPLSVAASIGAVANRKRTESGNSQDSNEKDREKDKKIDSNCCNNNASVASPGTSSSPPQFNPKAASMLAHRIRERKRRSLSHDSTFSEDGNNSHGEDVHAAGGGAMAALAMRRSRTSNTDQHHPNTVHENTNGESEVEETDSFSDNRSGTSSGLQTQQSMTKHSPQNVMRNTLAFAFGLSAMAKKSNVRKQSKVVCNFDDETIRIPGCHGNSVMKFEVFDGDRIIGKYVFSMRKEGALMYWGGEYQRSLVMTYSRRGVQLNSRIQLKKGADHHIHGQGGKNSADSMPALDFRVIAGPPLRSRCQWGRMMIRGNGPLQRTLRSRDGYFLMSNLNIFDHWERFYFSLDDVGLHFFENKFDQVPVATVLAREFKSVAVDMGSSAENGDNSSWEIPGRILKTLMAQAPVATSAVNNLGTVANKFVEDLFNVVLTTSSGEEINMRFTDAASRVAWMEVLQNTIVYHHRMSNCGGSTGSGSLAGTSVALRWFSSVTALRRGLPVSGSITGTGSTLIPVGSMQSNGVGSMIAAGGVMGSSAGGHGLYQLKRSTILSSSSSLFGLMHRSRSLHMRGSSSSSSSNQGVPAVNHPTKNNHSNNNNYNSGAVLPPVMNGPALSSSTPPIASPQYLPRSRLGSNESQGPDLQVSASPIFGNPSVVRQGQKYFVGHTNNGDHHNNNSKSNNNNNAGNNSSPNSLNGTPVVTKNKRTPPIFAVPYKNPQQQQSSQEPARQERHGSCDS